MSQSLKITIFSERMEPWRDASPSLGPRLCSACRRASATRKVFIGGPYLSASPQLIGYLCNGCTVEIENQVGFKTFQEEAKRRRVIECSCDEEGERC